MNHTYLALLRGINVGGNNMIKMAELRHSLESAEFTNVRSYIQTGNIFIDFPGDEIAATDLLKRSISHHFQTEIGVVLFSEHEWRAVIQQAPKTWGQNPEWKHNLLVLLKPYLMEQILQSIGPIKPDIEMLEPGPGVLYQSISTQFFGRATTGKLASNPAYKHMTIRNYNTTQKIAALFSAPGV